MPFKEREDVDPFFFDPEIEKDYQYSVCPECFVDPDEEWKDWQEDLKIDGQDE